MTDTTHAAKAADAIRYELSRVDPAVHWHATMDADVIEIGTPSKGGVKIHCDCNNLALSMEKIAKSMQLLKQAMISYELTQEEVKLEKSKPIVTTGGEE